MTATSNATFISELNVVKHEKLTDLVIDLNGVHRKDEDSLSQLEREHVDFSFFVDANLSSLVEMLQESGLEEQEIVAYNKNQYGPIVEFYEVGNPDSEHHYYMMAVGQR